MNKTHGVRRIAVSMNGIGVAYLVGFFNACLAVIVSFGVQLTDTQQVAIATVVNAALVLGIHLAHRVGEVAAAGGSGAMSRAQTAAVVADSMPAPVETPETP